MVKNKRKMWTGGIAVVLAAVVSLMVAAVAWGVSAYSQPEVIECYDVMCVSGCGNGGGPCGDAYVDADGDGVCDSYGNGACGMAGGAYIDANADGVCDNYGNGACGYAAGGACGDFPCGNRAYIDADGDGICDNCAYADADADGICDNYPQNCPRYDGDRPVSNDGSESGYQGNGKGYGRHAHGQQGPCYQEDGYHGNSPCPNVPDCPMRAGI